MTDKLSTACISLAAFVALSGMAAGLAQGQKPSVASGARKEVSLTGAVRHLEAAGSVSGTGADLNWSMFRQNPAHTSAAFLDAPFSPQGKPRNCPC